MTEPNPERGEVGITLDGTDYVLRPSYTAFIEIERMTGVGLVPLARRIMNIDYGLGDAVAIVTAGLKEAGVPAKPEKVGPMILKTGLLEIGSALTVFMTNALSGGEKPGEAKAAEQTESPTDASPPSPTPE